MKTSTTLASLAAAASLVGVIGIAYAQSDSGSQGGGIAQTPQQTQMAPADSGAPATSSDNSMSNSSTPSTNDTLANTQEPAPQADRN